MQSMMMMMKVMAPHHMIDVGSLGSGGGTELPKHRCGPHFSVHVQPYLPGNLHTLHA